MSRRPIGSIRWLSDGVARVEASAGWHPITGKRRRLSRIVHGDEKTAETMLARLLLEAGRVPETEVTVAQFLDGMWLPHCEERVRARTVDGYRSIVKHHIIPILGSTKLGQLTPFQLDRWMDSIKGEPQTRLHVYRCLSAALNQAVRWRLIDHSPLRAVEPPKVRAQRPDVLTATEANELLDAFTGHLLEPMILIALAAGLRRSELAGLTWADLDLGAGTVTVRRGRHDRRGGVIEEQPKSVTSCRTVALPPWAVDRLKELRGIGPLVTEHGEPIKPWRISTLYDRQVRAAKIRRVQLKQLRHTHACLMLEAGVDLYVVSRRLGHSTVAVTERHYVRPSEDADRAAAEAFGRVRPGAPSANVRQHRSG